MPLTLYNLSVMKQKSNRLICVTTDHVEANLLWEEEQYRDTGVDYRHYQLRFAAAREILEVAKDAHVLVVDQAKITPEVIAGLSACQLIIRHGDGYDNLNLEAATEAGIVCVNEPGFWSKEVALQAFALGLSLLLKIPVQQSIAASYVPDSNVGWNLAAAMPHKNPGNLVAGIIGFGKIGTHAVSLFGSVMKEVLVRDSHADPSEVESRGARLVSLDELLSQSDIISLHVPAKASTTGMFNRQRIASMKRGAVLVNTSRGSIVDSDALLAALVSGHLAGAALDSTVPEPLPGNHPLFDIPNLIITPHMGWYSEDALQAMRKQIVHDVLGVRDGRIPKTVLNQAVLKQANLRLK